MTALFNLVGDVIAFILIVILDAILGLIGWLEYLGNRDFLKPQPNPKIRDKFIARIASNTRTEK